MDCFADTPPALILNKLVNHLYCGDNLDILRKHIPNESVDLVYLDPPFNSKQTYFFKPPKGEQSEAQITAFEDTWHWTRESARTLERLKFKHGELAELLDLMVRQFGHNDLSAYLVMMAIRLVELHRVLKPTGSLYLHCDPTASHYLKIILDMIFGVVNFRNEIIWKRANTVKGNFGQGSKRWDSNTDTILFYRKTEDNTFNQLFNEYSESYIKNCYKYVEPETGRQYQLISMTAPGGAAKGNPQYEVMGITRYWRYSKQKMQDLINAGLVVQIKPGGVPRRKQYLDQGKGVPVQSLWDDIPGLHSQSTERLGYPTQKPLALLERIIQASTNPGDIVMDSFCGCGTAIHAAQKLGRQWIGIDITHLAIALIEKRLRDSFPGIQFTVEGTRENLAII